jgi:hypothetical protein
MNFDMVAQRIFNRRYFSTNATLSSKPLGIEIKLCRQWNKFTVGYDLMHVTSSKIILWFTTQLTSIDLCWGMNFDMVGQIIFNKRVFSTNTTIFLKVIGN